MWGICHAGFAVEGIRCAWRQLRARHYLGATVARGRDSKNYFAARLKGKLPPFFSLAGSSLIEERLHQTLKLKAVAEVFGA